MRPFSVPYILLHRQSEFSSTVEYYTYLIEHSHPRCRFWFACADDSPETLEFVARYGTSG